MYAESDEALEFAKTQMPVVMGRTVSIHVPQCLACVVNSHCLILSLQYTNLYLTFCYVHPEGVEEPNLTVKFQRRHWQYYGIIKVQ